MNRTELLEFHGAMCAQAAEIMAAKNHDYTGEEASPFANFEACEAMGITTTELGMLTRMTDKFKRLITFAKCGQLKVKDEGVRDTCLDLVNYAILFAARSQQ